MTDDLSQATTSQVAIITVTDNTPPALLCVGARVVDWGAVWDFDPPRALDDYDGTNLILTVLTTLTNGECAKDFTATRTWQAADQSGNTSTCSQSITVVDRQGPSLTCPAANPIEFTNADGSAFSFSQTATDVCGRSVGVVCVPPSGSTFPVGTNTVRCTAADGSANVIVCGFQVTVLGPLGVMQDVLAEASALGGTAWKETRPRHQILEPVAGWQSLARPNPLEPEAWRNGVYQSYGRSRPI